MSPIPIFRHRRWQVPRFVREMARRHPEIAHPVGWTEALAIAHREGVSVRVLDLPAAFNGRIARIGERVFVQINRRKTRAQQTMALMHELCHFWRDEIGEPGFYSSDGPDDNPSEEFADVFAWAVTSPARVFVRGIRPEDCRK